MDTSLIEKSVGKRGKILLVENDAVLARTLEQRLSAMNYLIVGIALNGTDAIEKAEDLRPDLVLMDIQIRGAVDGIEAADQIRTGFQIPVVYLASKTDEYTIARAKVTNPLGYIFKPFEERELEITVEMAIYKHQVEQEREGLMRELQEAMVEVRRLSGLLPICISCKQIRDDRGSWSRLEEYITKNSKARFTHGYCPDCARKFREGVKVE
ncbi:MAG: two component system response regulator [Verrucomicrobiales bacterium]|nr:two component system response regulator [Verrucomicrobiales bacterium]